MSITLTTPYAVSVNAVQVENDTVGACSGSSVDYINKTLTYTFQIGTLVGSPPSLAPGTIAANNNQNIVITVNLVTGAWSDNLGAHGVIPGATLNPIISTLVSARNTAEGFMAVSGGLMPGTIVSWTQL